MTISHHPSDETLLRYAAGRLEAAPALVIATHIAGCRVCRQRVMQFEALGGAVLEQIEPTLLAPDALAKALARIDSPVKPAPAPARRPTPASLPGGIEWPGPLRQLDVGPWRWRGPGVHISRVALPGLPRAKLSLIRIAPNRKLPEHRHSGLEFTQVISGSFSDGIGHYRPGDIAEADAEVEHEPRVDSDSECICLVALEGEMRFSGWVGRLIQPFARL